MQISSCLCHQKAAEPAHHRSPDKPLRGTYGDSGSAERVIVPRPASSLVPCDPGVPQRPWVALPGRGEPSLAAPPWGRAKGTPPLRSHRQRCCLATPVLPRPSAAALALAANGRQPSPPDRRRHAWAATGLRGRTAPAEGGAAAGPAGDSSPRGGLGRLARAGKRGCAL